jgi:NADPH:quinone reductase-like Zn-dependent oxidoreductase
MEAILITEPGNPDVLQLGSIPEPQITQPQEILIRLKAAGVNPIDTKLRRRGTFYPEQMPAILGCDGAGIVEEIGASVNKFKPGDEVYFCAGGVGHVAIQLAKIRGAKVATTVSTQDKARLARQLGADYPILYKDTNFVEAILHWTDGEGVDLAFDTVGGQNFYDTFGAVKVYGDIVTILAPGMENMNWKVARNRNLRISLELMLTPALQGLYSSQKYHGEILKQCATWIDEGKLTIHLSQTFPLSQAAIRRSLTLRDLALPAAGGDRSPSFRKWHNFR